MPLGYRAQGLEFRVFPFNQGYMPSCGKGDDLDPFRDLNLGLRCPLVVGHLRLIPWLPEQQLKERSLSKLSNTRLNVNLNLRGVSRDV